MDRFNERIMGADGWVNKLKDIVVKLEAIHAGFSKMLSATEVIVFVDNHTGLMRPDEDVVVGCKKELREMVLWLVDMPDAKARPVSVPIAAIWGHDRIGGSCWRSSSSWIRR
jgi:hypothetical protein